jgi:hypothetical protein
MGGLNGVGGNRIGADEIEAEGTHIAMLTRDGIRGGRGHSAGLGSWEGPENHSQTTLPAYAERDDGGNRVPDYQGGNWEEIDLESLNGRREEGPAVEIEIELRALERVGLR